MLPSQTIWTEKQRGVRHPGSHIPITSRCWHTIIAPLSKKLNTPPSSFHLSFHCCRGSGQSLIPPNNSYSDIGSSSSLLAVLSSTPFYDVRPPRCLPFSRDSSPHLRSVASQSNISSSNYTASQIATGISQRQPTVLLVSLIFAFVSPEVD